MAAVARGIDETSKAMHLMAFLVKHFIFIICFLKVQLYHLGVYLFLYLSIYIFYLTIFQPRIFSVQGSSLNFARTLGGAVDKLLNGSRVNFTCIWAIYFWKAKLEFVSRPH